MTDFIRIAAATSRVFDRSHSASTSPHATRAPLACVWTADPATGRLVSRWMPADADQSPDDQPHIRRDAGRPPGLRIAA